MKDKTRTPHKHYLIIQFTREEAELLEWSMEMLEGFVGLKGKLRAFRRLLKKLSAAITETYG